ncbi:MAG: FAD-dependent oxidoreductase [bacterium]
MVENIAILGAGVTGLSAAHRIRERSPDTNISVFDRDSQIGGMAKTIQWNGCNLDLGPHRFFTEIPGIEEFVRNLCANRFVPVERRSRMYLREKFLRYPVKPAEMMKALGIRVSAQIAFSSARACLSRRDPAPTTYQDYIYTRFGKKLYEILFGPYARKVWGCDPSLLEAETAIVRLRGDNIFQSLMDTLRGKGETYVSRFIYPTGGIGEIAAQLSRVLSENQLVLSTGEARPVIERGFCTGIKSAKKGFHPAGAVLSTIPLPALARALFKPDSQPHHAANELRFRALLLLFLEYEKELPFDDTWMYFPEEDIPFTRLNVPKRFHPDSVPSGKTVLCLECPCNQGDTLFQADESDLRTLADQYLQRMGLTDCDAAAGLLVRLAEGYPVYRLGYREHVGVIVDALKEIPNLVTAGRQGLFRHNNIDQAIQMGLLAGEHLSTFPTESSRWYDRLSQFDGYRIVD